MSLLRLRIRPQSPALPILSQLPLAVLNVKYFFKNSSRSAVSDILSEAVFMFVESTLSLPIIKILFQKFIVLYFAWLKEN